ncbi:hypothetical protein [Paraburkholderia tropica]|uniref:hypothetical protein n=1 Tax=Paraburkholderia tropica TaxID=92647 RepID=UPI002AB74199|nr:hypothetical protein [Paraburkholderia tropica]
MSLYSLRLYEDVLPKGAAPVYLAAAERALYVVDGSLTVEFADGAQHHPADTAWLGGAPVALLADGLAGARVWRWELSAPEAPGERLALLRSAPGSSSVCKLDEQVELDDRQSWLLRCDKVAFPPGGIAHTHVHQGPGIRCVLHGEITIETQGRVNVHKPGAAWLELGYEPVLAPTTESEATTFIRCFVLPQACRGRSSIRYVHAEDAGLAKPQRYHIFGERFLRLEKREAAPR